MQWLIELHCHTSRINELMGSWKRAASCKKRDRHLVARACYAAGVTRATCRRRVDLVVTLGPRQHADEDCWRKSLHDSLKRCGALFDDTPNWCEQGTVKQVRGSKPSMKVYLTDVDDEGTEE